VKKIDSLIFDIDGTIWDSVDVCAKAWNKVISENSDRAADVTGKELMGLFGKPMNIIFDALFPGMTKEEEERLSALCVEYENELLKTEPGIPYPEVVETLRTLSESYPLFIVSNCQSGYIEACMEALKIGEYITDYTCFGDHPVSKGQNILEIMKKTHMAAPVYIGDTAGDEEACREAGILFAYAAYGFGKAEEPDFRIEKFADLLELFGNSSFTGTESVLK